MYQSTFINLLLQFALFSFAMAEDTVVASTHGNWRFATGGGVFSFIVLILDIIVWMEVIKSNRPVSHKLLWCVGVFIFPIFGVIFYWLFSNRAAHAGSGGYEALP